MYSSVPGVFVRNLDKYSRFSGLDSYNFQFCLSKKGVYIRKMYIHVILLSLACIAQTDLLAL